MLAKLVIQFEALNIALLLCRLFWVPSSALAVHFDLMICHKKYSSKSMGAEK
jgi:hypothetical protein